MKRFYPWIPVLVAFCLSWGWMHTHRRPLASGIQLHLADACSKTATNQALTPGDLVWMIDEQGHMMTGEGRALWPDQWEPILHDEQLKHKGASIALELWIDHRCPFDYVAPVLQLCARHAVCVQVALKPSQTTSKTQQPLPNPSKADL